MQTIPNSHPEIQTTIELITPYSAACPHSGEPQQGSTISIEYTPDDKLIELHAVEQWLKQFSIGDEPIDLETVAQRTARAAGAALGVPVAVTAYYILRNDLRLLCRCSSIALEKIKPSTQ